MNPGPRQLVFFAVVAILAVRLFVPAALLIFSPAAAEAFTRSGLPAWVRPALAWPEMLGALLFAMPRSFYYGAVVLVLDLGGAIAAHILARQNPGWLGVFLGLVVLLGLLRRKVVHA